VKEIQTAPQANNGWRKRAVYGFCELWIPCYMDGRVKRVNMVAEARVS